MRMETEDRRICPLHRWEVEWMITTASGNVKSESSVNSGCFRMTGIEDRLIGRLNEVENGRVVEDHRLLIDGEMLCGFCVILRFGS